MSTHEASTIFLFNKENQKIKTKHNLSQGNITTLFLSHFLCRIHSCRVVNLYIPVQTHSCVQFHLCRQIANFDTHTHTQTIQKLYFFCFKKKEE
uniref:Uncharacterized protein n=1 Tax=Anguilla anguilla TaxID=7936 RepID=A0A0E9X6A0_ANGAN